MMKAKFTLVGDADVNGLSGLARSKSLDKSPIFLSIIFLAVFGAGIADVVFTDVVPIRPYTVFFQTYDTTSLSQMSHQLQKAPATTTNLPFTLIALVIVAVLAVFLAYHVAIIVPMGARGSHSRANRRANAGWKPLHRDNVREQFKILREIFGDPRMVIIYENNGFDKPKEKKKTKPD